MNKPNPPEALSIPTGTKVGFYVVERRLGFGGFGAVFLVTRDGKFYAIKVSAERLKDIAPQARKELEERFNREVAALSTLRHPNIVRVHGFDRWPDMDGYPFIVMEYVNGLALHQWQKAKRPSVSELLRVFAKLALALHEMHQRDVYHRDLKSANVLVRTDTKPGAPAEPVIVDFGLARPRSAYTVTHNTLWLGTLTHLAPEYIQFVFSAENRKPPEDGKPASRFRWRPTTDLYALGVMMYDALTASVPYAAENELELFMAIEQRVPQAPSVLNAALPAAVDALMMKLLEKDPARRHQNGEELAQHIDALLAGADPGDPAWTVPCSPGDEAEAKEALVVHGVDPHAPTNIKKKAGPSEAVDLGSVAGEPEPAGRPARMELSVDAPRDEPRKARVSLPTRAQRGFVAPEPPQGAAAPSDEDGNGEPKGQSTQMREAAALVQAAGGGKKGLPRGPLMLVGLFGVLLIALLFAAQALKDRQASSKPEDLLARVQKAEQDAKAGASPTPLPPPTPGDNAPTHLAPLPPADQPATGDSVDMKHTGRAEPSGSATHGVRTSEERAIDEELDKAPFAKRPKIAGPGAGNKGPPAVDSPFAPVHHLNAKAAPDGPRKFGIPLGAHIKVHLLSNLDSRTDNDAPAEAEPQRGFYLGDEEKLPTGTKFYGEWSASKNRFRIHFTKLVLPDKTEVGLDGIAVDGEDKKTGLKPVQVIAVAAPKGDSTATKVAKTTAATLMSQLPGDTTGQVAQNAGSTVLNEGTPASSSSGTSAIVLEAGVDFDVVVKGAF
jgi:serine/threonine protein kinase